MQEHQVNQELHFLFLLSYAFYGGKETHEMLVEFTQYVQKAPLIQKQSERKSKPPLKKPSSLSNIRLRRKVQGSPVKMNKFFPSSAMMRSTSDNTPPFNYLGRRKSALPHHIEPPPLKVVRRRSSTLPSSILQTKIRDHCFPLIWKDFLATNVILKNVQEYLGFRYLSKEDYELIQAFLSKSPEGKGHFLWGLIASEIAMKKHYDAICQREDPSKCLEQLNHAAEAWAVFVTENVEPLELSERLLKIVQYIFILPRPDNNLQLHSDTVGTFAYDMYNLPAPPSGTASRDRENKKAVIIQSQDQSASLCHSSHQSFINKIVGAMSRGFTERDYYLLQRASWQLSSSKPPFIKAHRLLEFVHRGTGKETQAAIPLDLSSLGKPISLKPPPGTYQDSDPHFYALTELCKISKMYFGFNTVDDYEKQLDIFAKQLYPSKQDKQRELKTLVTTFNKEVCSQMTRAALEAYLSGLSP